MIKAVKFFFAPFLVILLLFIFLIDSVFAGYSAMLETKVDYIVRYLDNDSSEIADQNYGNGYIGQTITIKSTKNITGYSLISDPSQSITLSANSADNVITFVYDLTQYAITYSLNGGTVSANNPASYTLKSSSITLNNPIRAGYTFLGWVGTSLSDNTVNVTIPAGSTGDRTYTAVWSSPVSYNVLYVLNGGKVTGTNPASYNVESSDITLINPQKSEYQFEGWSGTGISGKSMAVVIPKGSTGDRTYTANWSAPASYSIIYNLDGGKVTGTNPKTYNIESSNIKLINPQKNGYQFIGWSGTGISGKSLDVVIPKGSTGNRSFTANWSAPDNYRITYNLNGGKVNGTNPVTYNVESSDKRLINPEKIGFTFEGWSGTGISGRSLNVTIPKGSTGDRTYTANWSENNYTVTFLAGANGSFTVNSSFEGLHYGDATPDAPEVTANEGWEFTSWSPELAATVSGDASYTAQYAIMTFTVTFVDYDGAILSTQTVNWNTAATAPQSPSREGYTFKSWDKAFDSIKADTTVTALYDQIPVASSASLPSAAPSMSTPIPQELIPLTGGSFNNINWMYIIIPVFGILLIWLLLRAWFTVIPIAERVFNNKDGTYSVHWGYLNRKHRNYTAGKGKSVVSVIEGKIISSSSNAPVKFAKGRVRNAFSIVVDKDSYIEWRVKNRKARIDLSKIDK